MEGKRFRMDHFKLMAESSIMNIDWRRNCGELGSIEKTVNEIRVIRKMRKNALIT